MPSLRRAYLTARCTLASCMRYRTSLPVRGSRQSQCAGKTQAQLHENSYSGYFLANRCGNINGVRFCRSRCQTSRANSICCFSSGTRDESRDNASQVTAIGRGSDRSLHVRLVATPAHKFVGAWIAAQTMRGEKPGPTLCVCGVRIFFCQEPRQGDGNAFGKVLRSQSLGGGQLSLQSRSEALRE